jgi:hypothetical protein
MLLGITIYPLWKHRAQYVDALLALFRKPSSEEENTISYRLVWIGLIASFVIWIACGAAVNVPILVYALFAIIMIWHNLALLRIVSETGGYFGYALVCRWFNASQLAFLGGTAFFIGIGVPPELTVAGLAAAVFINSGGPQTHFGWTWPYRGGLATLNNMKVAMTQKLNLKKVLIYIVLLVSLVFVVGYVWNIFLMHNMALERPFGQTAHYIPFGWVDWYTRSMTGYPDSYPVYGSVPTLNAWTESAPTTITAIIIGIVVVLAVSFMRDRFSWFVIGPAGFVLGALAVPALEMWIAWLVALIIKYTVIKVGGMKLYNEKAYPFFIGSLMAWFLINFFGNIGGTFFMARWPDPTVPLP